MARDKAAQANINNADPINFPNARIENNTGGGNGTPVNESVYGDLHEFFAKLMRLYGISYNGLPDNEQNGYQLIEAVKSLASKNDFVIPLTTSDNVFNLPIKIGKLLENESIIIKATVDKGLETSVKGTLDNVTKTITYLGDFKANEYVRLINTTASIVLVRMIDSFNLSSAVEDLLFLRAATATETIDGVISNKGVTPESFLAAFAEYVIGNSSINFLADTTRNGLYSKEHFDIVENIAAPTDKYGTFDPADIGSTTPVGTQVSASGDIVSAIVNANDGNGFNGESYTLTLNSAMLNTNYSLDLSLESLGSETVDNNTQGLVWQKISPLAFKVFLEENSGASVQALRVHVTVKQR